MDEKLMNNKVELTDEEMSKAAGGYEEYDKTDYEMRKHDTIDKEPLFYVGEHICVGGETLGEGVVKEIKPYKNERWQYRIEYDTPILGVFFNGKWVLATDIYGHFINY